MWARRREDRFACVARWCGVAATSLIVGVYLLSVFLFASWTNASGESSVGIGGGAVSLIWTHEPIHHRDTPATDSQAARGLTIRHRVDVYFRYSPGWKAGRSRIAAVRWTPRTGTVTRQTWIDIPLWMPLAGVAFPTGVLCLANRRRRMAGHCRRCGYDLTGNESGVCSECGEEISATKKIHDGK